MLRQAFRRLFWMVPTLIGITLASFVLASYVPGPADDPNILVILGEDRAEDVRRSRFLDLPRFFNPNPVDVRVRVRCDAPKQVRALWAGSDLAFTYKDGEAEFVLPELGLYELVVVE